MKLPHPQNAATAVDAHDARTAELHPTQIRTLRHEHAPHRGRIAMSTTLAAAGGVALTMVLLGVSAGARADAPPSPGVAPSAETALHLAPSGECSFDPRYLPHTPDAVEGWYASCSAGAAADGRCRLDPRYLPHTPDAVEGWYASCRARRAESAKRS
jgi:hypothetical protein